MDGGMTAEAALERHMGAITIVAARLCRNYNDAEDAIASARLRLLQAAPRMSGDEPTTYSVRITRNLIVDKFRSADNRRTQSLNALESEDHCSLTGYDPWGSTDGLIVALDILAKMRPDHQVVVLALAEHGEIIPAAASLGISLPAFKSRLYRARFIANGGELTQPQKANRRYRKPIQMEQSEARDILGVYPGATPEQTKARYRLLARTAHPDGGGSNEAFQRLTAAYEALAGEKPEIKQSKAVRKAQLNRELAHANAAIDVEEAKCKQYSATDFRRKALDDWKLRKAKALEELAGL